MLDSELGGKTKFQEIGSVYGFGPKTRRGSQRRSMNLKESHIEDKYIVLIQGLRNRG